MLGFGLLVLRIVEIIRAVEIIARLEFERSHNAVTGLIAGIGVDFPSTENLSALTGGRHDLILPLPPPALIVLLLLGIIEMRKSQRHTHRSIGELVNVRPADPAS